MLSNYRTYFRHDCSRSAPGGLFGQHKTTLFSYRSIYCGSGLRSWSDFRLSTISASAARSAHSMGLIWSIVLWYGAIGSAANPTHVINSLNAITLYMQWRPKPGKDRKCALVG